MPESRYTVGAHCFTADETPGERGGGRSPFFVTSVNLLTGTGNERSVLLVYNRVYNVC